jgi:hypothetical protein
VLLASPSAGLTQDIETLGSHCNDAPFGSDGGGISACIELAIRYDDLIAGIGIFGVTPEQKNNDEDPLEEKARIVAWFGREMNGAEYDYAFAFRAGLEGGAADDIAIYSKELVHEAFGFGNRKLVSQNDTSPIAGVSGWMRTDYEIAGSGTWSMDLAPYGHGAVGLDTVEAGTGVMLMLQPRSESKGLALLLPKTGAYAPVYGGDGIGIFAGVRAVAHEGFYEKRANRLVAEAGITAQATLFEFVRVGVSTSCTNPPYEGANSPDCKLNFQLGGLF